MQHVGRKQSMGDGSRPDKAHVVDVSRHRLEFVTATKGAQHRLLGKFGERMHMLDVPGCKQQ
eukprot:2301083-Rhodomonas_salina.3